MKHLRGLQSKLRAGIRVIAKDLPPLPKAATRGCKEIHRSSTSKAG